MPLLTAGVAWLAGLFAGSWAQPPVMLLAAGAVVSAGIGLLRTRGYVERLSMLALAMFLLGLARYEVHAQSLAAADLSGQLGTIVVTGMVYDDPVRRARSQQLVVAVQTVERFGQTENAAGRAKITVPPLPEHQYGDVLRLSGRLEAPPTFADFDYREYLYRHGISAVMAFPKVEPLAQGQGSAAWAALYTLHAHLARSLAAQVPEPHASLAQGIVLGQRSGIPNDLTAAFARTGTTHLLAVSGQNLSIAAALAVAWGSRAFGRRHPLYYLAVLGFLWGYTLIAGASASVMRAAIMSTLMVAAAGLGRPGGGLAALVAAAAVMAALDPFILWDAGFALSFLALAGVLFLAPILEAAAWRAPGLRGLRLPGLARTAAAVLIAGLAAVFGASLMTLPIVWNTFHSTPALALPATLFALPAFPVIMCTGALTALLDVVHPALAAPFAGLTWAGTAWLIAVVRTWAAIPFASVGGDPLPAAVWWAYGTALFAAIGGTHRRWHAALWRPSTPRPDVKVAAIAGYFRGALTPQLVAAAIVAAAILGVGWGDWDREARFWFLDGGDAVLVRTPGGATVLIGGSADPGALAQALGRALPFWHRSVDLAILPDPGLDYLPGMLMVLERYQVGQVMESEATASSAAYQAWERAIQESNLPRTRLHSGMVVGLGDGLALRVVDALQSGGLALALEGPAGSILLLDRASTLAVSRSPRSPDGSPFFDRAQESLMTNGVMPILKLAWRVGDRPVPEAVGGLRPPVTIVTGMAPPSPSEDADRYATAERGTVELGWHKGAGWLRTER